MAPVAIATSYGFIPRVVGPPKAIVIGSRHVPTKQMASFVLLMNILEIVLVCSLTAISIPLIWK